ncbi:cof1 [Symbiodinium natans]|uniref:Cof1 protein n=1 Tax=Symbiodinium natans TaxID=878477 RepID=A0A812QDS5_9DINO|nr:cof1 [Symbiodinium natans]
MRTCSLKACPPAPKTSSPRRRPWPVGAFPHGPRCPWVLCWSRRSWASVSPSLPKAFIQLFNPAFGTGVQATDAALNAVESTEGRTFSYVTFELQSGAFGATQPQLVTHPMNQATDFKQLVDAMPATEPRYAMVHMPNQMVFVHWSPDTAMATTKSMYMSSAKGIQDSLGSPVSLSILAKDKNELSQELEKIAH